MPETLLPRTADVAVVGAGPTGLLLSAILAERGLDVVLLEGRDEPDPLPRANGVVGRAVPVLERRGLYRDLVGHDHSLRGWMHRAGTGNLGRHPRPAPVFGYAGFQVPLRRLADNPVYVLPVPQSHLETVLEADALRHGVDVRRGCSVTRVEQDAEAVAVVVDAPHGQHSIRASYLVGCDGAHSLVRKAAGFGFSGRTLRDVVARHAHVAIPRAVLTPAGRLRVPAGAGSGRTMAPFRPYRTEHGVFMFGSFSRGLHVVTTREWDPPTEADDNLMTITELSQSASRVLGFPLELSDPPGTGPYQLRRTASRNARVADTFRNGRVLLAGDAAHVFTGYGAPALNTAILDVDALGPLLADVIRGAAPDTVLDDWSTDRADAARRTMAFSATQDDLLAPGDDVTARRADLARRLRDPDVLVEIARGIAGG